MNRWTMRPVNEAPHVDFQTTTTAEVEKLMLALELPATLAVGERRSFSVNLVGLESASPEEILLIQVVGPAD